MKETPEGLEELIRRLVDSNESEAKQIADPPVSVYQDDTDQTDDAADTFDIPSEVPILPLRGLVVFPQTVIPITVGQSRSIRLIEEALTEDNLIGLFTAHDPENELPAGDEIHHVGTLAGVQRLFHAPDGTIRILVEGISRIRIDEFTQQDPYLRATIIAEPEEVEQGIEVEALERSVTEQFQAVAELNNNIPSELISSLLSIDNPLQLAYSVATFARVDTNKAQALLEENSTAQKLGQLLQLLNKEHELLELGRKIQSAAQNEIEKSQREYYLREQMKAIQRELEEGEDQIAELDEFRQKIEESGMSDEARKEAERELDRLSGLSVASAEYGVIRTYLDWLTSMPWSKRTEDNLEVRHAREILNKDHYGLEDIKERILEFLAVRKLRAERAEEIEAEEADDDIRRTRQGAILLFVGPPGVGKTSLGASIARAMGRKFIRMSLGGVRDEAEIRGFRRTYIGAMPGRIVQTLRRAESRNPLIMLDEVDKLGRDFRGDPASALLELLDPEQNAEFRDTYLDVPFDLSEVFFITTANNLDTIPGPLLDRMEVIQLSGYTDQEKLAIAREYLVPRQIKENGLRLSEVEFGDDAIQLIIDEYTREAGVRNLEREIGRTVRKVVTRIAEGEEEKVVLDAGMVKELLRKPRYGLRTDLDDRTDMPGVATGLAWTPVGGDVLFIEATQFPGSKGFQFTGQLGEVMQESARIALSYIRSKSNEFNLGAEFFKDTEIHLHVPAGATPKDGPSAGVTMAVALASLLSHRPTRSNVAMTGELTLNGQVLPVGGIKDKVLAAHRLGIDTIILPKKNQADLEDLPEEIRDEIRFVPIEFVDEAIEVALQPASDSNGAVNHNTVTPADGAQSGTAEDSSGIHPDERSVKSPDDASPDDGQRMPIEPVPVDPQPEQAGDTDTFVQ